MFEKILIDLNYKAWMNQTHPDFEQEFDQGEYNLIPFLYLIGEEIIETSETPPKFENKEQWSIGIAPMPGKPTFVRQVHAVGQGRPCIIDLAKNMEGVFFSPLKNVKATVMQSQGISAENCVLILAAAGLEILIPNFNFNLARSDEIVTVKEKLSEERQNYLHAITKLADETYERLTNKVYKDTVEWALSESFFKIKPKAEDFERKMRKLDKKLLQRLGVDFIKEGIPTICSVALEKDIKLAAAKAIEVVLETLCGNLVSSIEERKVPEVVYGYKLAKLFKIK